MDSRDRNESEASSSSNGSAEDNRQVRGEASTPQLQVRYLDSEEYRIALRNLNNMIASENAAAVAGNERIRHRLSGASSSTMAISSASRHISGHQHRYHRRPIPPVPPPPRARLAISSHHNLPYAEVAPPRQQDRRYALIDTDSEDAEEEDAVVEEEPEPEPPVQKEFLLSEVFVETAAAMTISDEVEEDTRAGFTKNLLLSTLSAAKPAPSDSEDA